MDSYREIVGKYIKRRIDAIGVDQVVVARVVGIDPSNLSRIINGRYAVGIDVLERICRVIGLQIAFIEPFSTQQSFEYIQYSYLNLNVKNFKQYDLSAN